MNISDAVSALTGGFWTGFATVSTGLSRIPKTATLTLSKLTESASTGGSRSRVWTDVQALMGSLQPTNAKEKEEWSKLAVKTDYKFYVSESQFENDANLAELKESAKLTMTSPTNKTFNIVGIMDRSIDGDYYLVFLQERK